MRYLSGMVLCLALVFPFASGWADEDHQRFNRDVKRLTGDWEAEPWHFGWRRLHQENFNEVADEFFLHLWEEERPKNRTAQQVLENSFQNSKIGDVDAERVVSMADATVLSSGIHLKTESWNSQFGRYTTFWGVIPRPKRGFISFKAQCNFRPYKTITYTGEKCIGAISKLLESVQNGSLRMPRPEAPVALAGWKGQIQENGIVRMYFTGWFGGYSPNTSTARTAHIYVARPISISVATERSAVAAFADSTRIQGFGPSTAAQWTQNVLVRTQPEAGEGPAIQLAMAVPNPGGRKSLISLSCWNQSWKERCMRALDQVVHDVQTGFIEEKWRAFR